MFFNIERITKEYIFFKDMTQNIVISENTVADYQFNLFLNQKYRKKENV